MMGKKLLGVLILIGLIAGTPWGAGLWVHSRIQDRMGIHLEGKHVPLFFQTAFTLKNARFEWDGRVRLLSGSVRVEYDLVSLVTDRLLKVKLSGRNLDVELLGDWAQIEGVHDARLERFRAELGLDSEGVREIYFVEALSPAFQFHVEKNEL